jgi:hypothetical protein
MLELLLKDFLVPSKIASPEALYIAGCAGGLLTFLGEWRLAKHRSKGADIPTVLLYILMTGYFSSVIVNSQSTYQAFCWGVTFDIVLRAIRKAADHLWKSNS